MVLSANAVETSARAEAATATRELIAWAAGQNGSDMIALDLATGKERWRVAAPRGPNRIALHTSFQTAVV